MFRKIAELNARFEDWANRVIINFNWCTMMLDWKMKSKRAWLEDSQTQKDAYILYQFHGESESWPAPFKPVCYWRFKQGYR